MSVEEMMLKNGLMFCFVLFTMTLSIRGEKEGEESLRRRLSHFEIIQLNDRRLVKRGDLSRSRAGYVRIEELRFSAFGRDFFLLLTPKHPPIDADALLRRINENGISPFGIDSSLFYGGHVHGEEKSEISLTFDSDRSVLGSIRLRDETFMLEPAWRHIPSSHPNDILIYRVEDIRSTPRYGAVNAAGLVLDDELLLTTPLHRSKRQVEGAGQKKPKNRCSLKLVADHSFFENVGNRSIAISARYLINMIDRINAIYTNVSWGPDINGNNMTNMGFVIKDMLIHTVATEPGSMKVHYNMKRRDQWIVSDLLSAFSAVQGSDQFCLVHLFTSHSFSGGVLGLGYIASPDSGTAGGICTATSYKDGQPIYFNTALSSSKGTFGDTVVARESEIVTAHELGHNWGSFHDSEQCSPSERQGGFYIMNTYSVSGYDVNNIKFSPCSMTSIGAVLRQKSGHCFVPESKSFCGNGRVEEDEECDAGGLVAETGEQDRCCSSLCRLRWKAKCSPRNSPCCSMSCQFLPSDHICAAAAPLRCRLSSHCTGKSGECPEAPPIKDGEECAEGGECIGGRCGSFCERRKIGKKPCICSNPVDSCFRCCRSGNQTADCLPYNRSVDFIMPNGTRCIHGSCDRGVCIKEVTDVISHLFKIIENISRTTFWKFVGDNLVGIIVACSTLLWVPLAWLVSRMDTVNLENGP